MFQLFPSKLYSVVSTPEESSVASRVAVISEVYQLFNPWVPEKLILVSGGISSVTSGMTSKL